MDSFGVNSEAIQKSAPATTDLSVKIPSGGIMSPPVRSLHTIMLNPNIAYAANAAACPTTVSLVAIVSFCLLFRCKCIKFS